MSIFSWLFGAKPIEYPLGALKSPVDHRTIAAVAIQAPAALPDDYMASTSPVDYQFIPDCVGEAIKEVKEGFLLDRGNFVALSAEDLYDQCKAQDGIPDQQGTYPLVGAKVACGSGIASQSVYESGDPYAIAADRAKYKLGGFVSVFSDYDHVCQAIYQNKRITACFAVDANWFIGVMTRVLKALGTHYTLLHGFYRPKMMVRGMNSWGTAWIGKVAGFIDASLAPGHFDLYWPDVSDSVTDIYAFTDIPAPVLDHIKSLNYYFGQNLKEGMRGYDVIQLQKRLDKEGYWPQGQSFTGYYGIVTSAAVLHYQLAKGVIKYPSGSKYGTIFGPYTRTVLNGEHALDEVSAQIQVESSGNDYAIGDINLANHAYGCLQIRQGVCDDLNAHLGTHYQAKDMLGNRALSIEVRTKYFTNLYPQFDTPEKRAKVWNGGPGYMQYYGKVGRESYTALLDAYWSKMSAMMA